MLYFSSACFMTLINFIARDCHNGGGSHSSNAAVLGQLLQKLRTRDAFSVVLGCSGFNFIN